jgi:hypothetical protein
MTKSGLGRRVEQISRELRVFVVGGGSEEVLDDVGMRILLASRSPAKTKRAKL